MVPEPDPTAPWELSHGYELPSAVAVIQLAFDFTRQPQPRLLVSKETVPLSPSRPVSTVVDESWYEQGELI